MPTWREVLAQKQAQIECGAFARRIASNDGQHVMIYWDSDNTYAVLSDYTCWEGLAEKHVPFILQELNIPNDSTYWH